MPDLATHAEELRRTLDGFRGWVARTIETLQSEPAIAPLLPRAPSNRRVTTQRGASEPPQGASVDANLESEAAHERGIDVDDPYAATVAAHETRNESAPAAVAIPSLTSRLDADPYADGATLRPTILVGVATAPGRLTSPSVDAEDPYL